MHFASRPRPRRTTPVGRSAGHKLRLQQPEHMPNCPDRRGRHSTNPFHTKHGRVKRAIESFSVDELVRAPAASLPGPSDTQRVCEQASALPDDEVDHVCVWPEEDREPGSTYDRTHFRIVLGGRILGFHNDKKPHFCNGSRDPRFACRQPVSWVDAVSGGGSKCQKRGPSAN